MQAVIVTAIVFGSVLAVIKLILDYRRDKNQISATSRHAEPSLTTSELKALLTEAVEKVVGARLDRLEKRLEAHDRPRLAPSSTTTRPDDAELEHPAQPLVGRDREATQ